MAIAKRQAAFEVHPERHPASAEEQRIGHVLNALYKANSHSGFGRQDPSVERLANANVCAL